MPRVSVVIPTHNRARYVVQALDSVLKQSYPDFEVIIVDNGSTDDTAETLRPYSSKTTYVYKEDGTVAEARNTGIRAAQGEYIAFLDDDDVWLPQKLERQVSFLDSNPHIGLVHTATEVIDDEGHLLEKWSDHQRSLHGKATELGYTYEAMSRQCFILMSTVMVTRACFDRVGLFDQNIHSFEDWDLFLRVALEYPIAMINEPLVRYRAHQVSVSTGREPRDRGQLNELSRAEGRILVATKHLSLLETENSHPARDKARLNFSMTVADACYITMDCERSRQYTLRALRLNPFAFFASGMGVRLAMTALPPSLIRGLRQVRSRI